MLRILIYARSHHSAALLQGIFDTIAADVDTTLHAPTMVRLNESRIYDYIISDDATYFADDIERVRCLRRGNLRQPRIYIIGSEDDIAQSCRLLANGIDQYISRPLHPARLLNKVVML